MIERHLQEAFDKVEAPTKLVGRIVPDFCRMWAENRGLEVQETDFAPEGRLFIIGAVEVPNLEVWAREP